MLVILGLYATERINDLELSYRDERQKVFSIFVVFYLTGTAVLWSMRAPAIIVALMASYTSATCVVQIITRYWKISTHALAVTASIVALSYLYGVRPLPFAVLIPLVAWSRVHLKAHTVGQVAAGTALGACAVVIFFSVFHVT